MRRYGFKYFTYYSFEVRPASRCRNVKEFLKKIADRQPTIYIEKVIRVESSYLTKLPSPLTSQS